MAMHYGCWDCRILSLNRDDGEKMITVITVITYEDYKVRLSFWQFC